MLNEVTETTAGSSGSALRATIVWSASTIVLAATIGSIVVVRLGRVAARAPRR